MLNEVILIGRLTADPETRTVKVGREYMQAKALLNSVYGMTVQSPIKRTLIYNGWSWARYELQCMIDVCGHDCVYTDTDSVKFVNNHDFTAYNNKCKTLKRD